MEYQKTGIDNPSPTRSIEELDAIALEEKEKIQREEIANREIKRIAKHLKHVGKGEHNKFCPCCNHKSLVGFQLQQGQKKEFLEYIKGLSIGLKKELEETIINAEN